MGEISRLFWRRGSEHNRPIFATEIAIFSVKTTIYFIEAAVIAKHFNVKKGTLGPLISSRT
jgi:hypothetical protein